MDYKKQGAKIVMWIIFLFMPVSIFLLPYSFIFDNSYIPLAIAFVFTTMTLGFVGAKLTQ